MPRDEAGEALLDFFHRFVVQCLGREAFFGRGMGAAADSCVKKVGVPVIASFCRAAFIGEVEEHRCCRMGEGRARRAHQTTNGAVVLTLCLGQGSCEWLVGVGAGQFIVEERARVDWRFYMGFLVESRRGKEVRSRGGKLAFSFRLTGSRWGARSGSGGQGFRRLECWSAMG